MLKSGGGERKAAPGRKRCARTHEKVCEAELLPRRNPRLRHFERVCVGGKPKVSRDTARRIVAEDLRLKSIKKTKSHRLGTKTKQKRPNDGVLLNAAFSREQYDIRTVFSPARKCADTATLSALLVRARARVWVPKGANGRISPRAC